MSNLEETVAALVERVGALEAKVEKLEKGRPKTAASRPASAATGARPKSAASRKSENGSTPAKRSPSKGSVKSRRAPSASSSTTDFKKEDIPDELQGSYFVGKRKVPYLLPDSFLGQSPSDAPPATELVLDYVHGYNGRSCNQNIKVIPGDKDGSFVYVIAATGVVHNPKTKAQRYFRGHNEDIVSFAAHPSAPVVATGQTDPKGAGKPYVCVWDYSADEPKELGRLDEFHDRGICAIAFSHDGSQMVTVGMDDNHTVAVWDTPSGGKTVKKPKMSANGSKAEVLDAAFSPTEEFRFMTVGAGAAKVWTLEEGRLKSSTVSVMGKNKDVEKSFLSVRYLPDGRAIIGGKSGRVYVIGLDGKLEKTLKGHAKDVGAVTVAANGEHFYTAGGERVIQWGVESMEKEAETEMKSRPVAMDDNGHGGLVVGTFGNSVFFIDRVGDKGTRVIDGHSGEIWGLAMHPSQDVFATGAHDRTVRVWNSSTKESVDSFSLPAPKTKTKEKDAVRSLAFSPAGDQLAVGTKLGAVFILSFPKLEVLFQKSLCKEQVDALNFSPNGQLLAAGSWDQTTVLLDTASKRTVTLRGHTSSITHLTFSTDSKYLATNSRDYEILYWDCETGKRVSISVTREVEWHDWQNILGWPVRGVFGSGMDGTDINAVNVSKNNTVIAAGDDFGLVHLFKYPALHESPKDKTFTGHSSHVTNVRFSHDDQILISCGGLDYGVFQWRHQ